jgi:aerobic-type carbon monoxide dehydrogenase small subunit (CoxS/CutS family)
LNIPRTTPYYISAVLRVTPVVNGESIEAWVEPGDRLLHLLRDRLGLLGSKDACGRGECGACTVLLDGRPVMACLVLAARAGGVETIEGLWEEARPLREAFADAGAFQCGFCTPGQIVRGVALLREGLPVDERALRRAVSGNICRCTGYVGIVEALRRADRARNGGSAPATAPSWPAPSDARRAGSGEGSDALGEARRR